MNCALKKKREMTICWHENVCPLHRTKGKMKLIELTIMLKGQFNLEFQRKSHSAFFFCRTHFSSFECVLVFCFLWWNNQMRSPQGSRIVLRLCWFCLRKKKHTRRRHHYRYDYFSRLKRDYISIEKSSLRLFSMRKC